VTVLGEYPVVQTDAMTYGTAMHKAAEDYVGEDKPLPDKFMYVKGVLDELLAFRGTKLTEQRLGLTRDLKPCGFKDKDVWFRGIVDLAIVDTLGERAWIVDYKTGKSTKYADKGQLELMALSIFKKFPDVKHINAALLFVVANEIIEAEYKIESSFDLWGKWLKKYARMEKAYETDVWNPRPSGLCYHHCPVLECVHNGRN
tara:strand:- start:261 stop:863 length:603 start_codon:yes stop_codon:yes gene_type:complete